MTQCWPLRSMETWVRSSFGAYWGLAFVRFQDFKPEDGSQTVAQMLHFEAAWGIVGLL